jgi:hypothetical protein
MAVETHKPFDFPKSPLFNATSQRSEAGIKWHIEKRKEIILRFKNRYVRIVRRVQIDSETEQAVRTFWCANRADGYGSPCCLLRLRVNVKAKGLQLLGPLLYTRLQQPKISRNSAYVAIVRSMVKPSLTPMMTPELSNYRMFSNWSAASAWDCYKRPDSDEALLGCSLTTVSIYCRQDWSSIGHRTASRSSIDL